MSWAVNKVAQAIQDTLFREYVKFPTTPQERAAAKYKFINAPQPFEGAIGAINCTHVAIRRPREHEEDHYNHYGYRSLNCQAVSTVYNGRKGWRKSWSKDRNLLLFRILKSSGASL